MSAQTPLNPKKRKPSSPYMASIAHSLPDDCSTLLAELQDVLQEKAPEALPLLEKLLTMLIPNPNEIVQAERASSVVIAGAREVDDNASPSSRQAASEESGKKEAGKSRLIKCVFSSRRFYFDTLKNARLLRSIPEFKNVFIRRSMTPSEIDMDKQLRARAKDLNQGMPNGEKVYVVFRQQVVKKSDIPGILSQIKKLKRKHVNPQLPYLIVRKDRIGRRGGGICILLQSQVDFKPVQFDVPNLAADVLCMDILNNSLDYTRFVLVYRPPSHTLAEDVELCDLLSDLCSVTRNVVLLGDFNLDIDWSITHAPSPRQSRFRRFTSLFSHLGLVQLISEPTCGHSILDLVLTSPDSGSDAAIGPPLGTSDHHIANVDAVNSELDRFNWLDLFNGYHTIDDVYNRFLTAVHSLIDRYVPMRRMIHPFDKYPQHIKIFFTREKDCSVHLKTPYCLTGITESTEISRSTSNVILPPKKGNFLSAQALRQEKEIFCLYDSDGRVLTTDSEKDNVLADYFASVFSSTETLLGSTPILVNSECLFADY
ncbi:hypothetical protein OSTOST_00388 [Ostertagia ostertagi]